MYTVRPKGINIRDNERNVVDGFLQESINLQWRDGSYRPIPERLPSGILNTSDKQEIILHKVSDEDKINVLMFDAIGDLYWYGTIENGIYTAKITPVAISDFPTVTNFNSLSFTILNGLIYFMSDSQLFYYRLQFNESNQDYEVKDMYAWKELIPFYPIPPTFNITIANPALATVYSKACGVICYRFTLVLKTGEEVLHSPIYSNVFHGIVFDGVADDLITNIHTFINTNLVFSNPTVFENEISAINVYATRPVYISRLLAVGNFGFEASDAKNEINKLSEEPFYLINTIDTPPSLATEKLILITIDTIDAGIDFGVTDYITVYGNTITTGALLPIDNFSYHKLYGKITSNSGRLIIESPKTILSNGHMRALSIVNSVTTQQSHVINTEDGKVSATNSFTGRIQVGIISTGVYSYTYRGLLSYPDISAEQAGAYDTTNSVISLYKTRPNKAHNLACNFNQYLIRYNNPSFTSANNANNVTINYDYEALHRYFKDNANSIPVSITGPASYDSNNRIQFSESGEFSVWPVLNSYRVGEGRILFVGINSIDPSNSDYISPLLIGTSEGIFTVNYDTTGNTLVQSITKAATMPAISKQNIQIDQNLIYVSDKGLIAINSGSLINLTNKYFPEQGSGNFPIQNNVFPNYNVLTNDFFGGSNPYSLTDIIDYLKNAIFAYDGRRNNLWCSNPNENISLIYNFENNLWDTSTYVFDKVVDFFGVINTSEGDIYSRYLVINSSGNLDVLSGENPHIEIDIHLLTRPIKFENPDVYKKIERLISRCELLRSTVNGYIYFGMWGKQDLNKDKVNIPLVAFKDDSINIFPNNIRQDIPVGRQKGKYKTITILQGGKVLPESSIDGFEIVSIPIENKALR